MPVQALDEDGDHMLSRDDIIELMQEAGWKEWHEGLWGNGHDGCMFLRALERFTKLAYEAGAAAERNRMIADGWRQCAQGQKTTQWCAQATDRLARHGIPFPGDDDGPLAF